MLSLLPYENQIFLDLFHNDGLLVMAEGLGIERILLNFIKLYCDPTHFVLIINTNDAVENFLLSKLKEENIENLPKRITTETHSINERTQAYLKGGCFFITSRILVVDLLTDRIPVDLINGILVYKAHKIIDSCQETFILRLYRQKNKKGFIKAFSDHPIMFAKSGCKIERIMKNLFVKKLFLYPRFHVEIESTLSKYKPEVIEIHVSLSKYSQEIQMALLDIINILLQELKGCCSYIDSDFLTMENVISKPFDRIIKYQLEYVWNQIGSKPKQLINDMKTLRLLLHYLTQYDCFTFYRMLKCLKSHEKDLGRGSGWIFLDSANKLFMNARLRVFGNNKNQNSKTASKGEQQKSSSSKDEKEELNDNVIEESPKLKALKEVLSEISEDKDDTLNEINILITANNDRTCLLIKQFLNNNEMLQAANTAASKGSKFEEAILIEKIANLNEEDEHEEFIEKLSLKNNLETNKNFYKKQKAKQKRLKSNKKEKLTTLTQMAKKNKDENDESSDDEDNCNKNSKNSEKKFHIFLSALEGSEKQKMALLSLIYDLKLKYVILYDIELRFVRQLEMYRICNPLIDFRIYFLIYTNSCEEQRYLTSIRSEKEAFELLIKEKAAMIIPDEQDGKMEYSLDKINEDKTTIEAKFNSRQGGNLKPTAKDEQSRIIVDIREFRSELPSLIHKRNIHVEPVTIEVGDYILTPDMCVERKSLNDLIESLSNGRLYNQVNAMCRYYKIPILLIEFDQNKPFVLSNAFQSSDISVHHISSKLVILTLHFPKLRILWCSSPHEAAEMFEELKANYPQPSVEMATSIRTDQIGDNNESKYNPILKDLLLKIPGVTTAHCGKIMNKYTNLNDFIQKDEETLKNDLENTKLVKSIHEFWNKSINKGNEDDNDNYDDKPVKYQKKF